MWTTNQRACDNTQPQRLLAICLSLALTLFASCSSVPTQDEVGCGGPFEQMLTVHSLRRDVELEAALGANYCREHPEESEAILRTLDVSKQVESRFGNKIYRVQSVKEVSLILSATWPNEPFDEASRVGQLMRMFPYPTVALMECDNSRIFFFDSDQRFVASSAEFVGERWFW